MSKQKMQELDFNMLDQSFEDILPVVDSFEEASKVKEKKTETSTEDEEDLKINEITSIKDLEEDDPDDEDSNDDEDDNEDFDSGSTNKDNNESGAKTLYEFFKSKDIIEADDEEFQDDEDWVVDKTIQTLIDRNLDPTIKYINDLYKNGVSLDTLIQTHAAKESYEKIDDETILEDEKTAEKIVRDYLSQVLDQDDDEVSETIETLKDADILNKKAVAYKSKLIKHQEKIVETEKKQKQLEYEEGQRREKERMLMLKKMVDSTPEFIKGVPILEKEKNIFYEAITKKDRDGLTRYQRELMDPEMQLKVAQFVVLLGGNLDKVKDRIKTNVTKELKTKTDNYKENKKNSKDLKSEAERLLEYIKRTKNKS